MLCRLQSLRTAFLNLAGLLVLGGGLGLPSPAQEPKKSNERVKLERAGANASTAGTTNAKSSDTGSDARASEGDEKPTADTQVAVFGGGCFWCLEAVFERVWGVESVVSGYSGGNLANPSYQQVLTDQTGHAEVIKIEFHPDLVSYEDLLMIFLKSHDPTSLNAQGPDHGTRYRSVIYFVDDAQKDAIEEVFEEVRKKKTIRGKIVTEVSPLKNFYIAEDYHQDYFAKHPELPYCEMNIRPKIGKFEKAFKSNSKVQKAKEAAKSKKP